MSRERENDCVGCATDSYPCIGYGCRYRNVLHIYCDDCGDEEDDMYAYDGKDYCRDCLIERLITDGVVEHIDYEALAEA